MSGGERSVGEEERGESRPCYGRLELDWGLVKRPHKFFLDEKDEADALLSVLDEVINSDD